jgi:hypothetical protein
MMIAVTGVHVWFPVNHAVFFHDSIAFHITGGGNRLNGCYIDGGRAIFTERALTKNIWTNGFECCQGAAPAPGTTASGILLVGEKVGPGLQIMNNVFGGGSVYHCSSAGYANGFQCTAPDYTITKESARRDCTNSFNVSSAGRDCQGLDAPVDPAHAPGCACARGLLLRFIVGAFRARSVFFISGTFRDAGGLTRRKRTVLPRAAMMLSARSTSTALLASSAPVSAATRPPTQGHASPAGSLAARGRLAPAGWARASAARRVRRALLKSLASASHITQ